MEVKKGEVIGFVGPNGAGKTTTLKLIARLMKPTSGKIYILNKQGTLQNIQKKSKSLIEMGFLIDIPNFYNMSAYQILKYFAELHNYPKDKINRRIDEFLDLFKLTEWKHENIKNFSKGMKQKIGFIQAIIHDPEIIILDEPQTGLDPLSRVEIRRYIKELQSQGKTIFIASHMLYEISEICDKIAIINQGSIVGFDTVDNLARVLRTSEINCELYDSLVPHELEPLLNRLTEKLKPYLDKNLDHIIAEIPSINYNPNVNELKIYYDGNRKSRVEILKILIKEFESDFAVVSYTQEKTSQLEKVYAQMFNNPEKNKIRQEEVS